MKWVVKSYFAPDERSKGEWKIEGKFDKKSDAERYAKALKERDQLWTEYHVCKETEKIRITATERHFIDIMNMTFRDYRVDRKAVDEILSQASRELEKELFKAECVWWM